MSRQYRRDNKRKPTLIMIVLLAVISVGLLSVALYERAEARREAARYEGEGLYQPEAYQLEVNGTVYHLREGLDTYLLIGLDKFTDDENRGETVRNNQQSDFLLLMIVDQQNRRYCGLHINRDTMTEIERYGIGGVKLKSMIAQLALSHTYGSGGAQSCRYTCNAVSKLLYDIPIRHYLSLTMDAIPAINDLVGGVTVLIEDDFSGVDPALEQGTRHRLVGQEALTFVRARGGMNEPTNLKRMERQRVYMDALYEQFNANLSTDESFALRLADEISPYMVSDLNTERLAKLAEEVKGYRYDGVESMEGEAVVGEKYWEFYPDESALLEQVIRLFLTA